MDGHVKYTLGHANRLDNKAASFISNQSQIHRLYKSKSTIRQEKKEEIKIDLLFSPLVLTANLVLLLRGEVILNVERLADLIRRLALDHVGDGLAADIQQGPNIQVVSSLYIS